MVINVLCAECSYKPVHVDGNPLCTYRRNGEGDSPVRGMCKSLIDPVVDKRPQIYRKKSNRSGGFYVKNLPGRYERSDLSSSHIF